MVPCYSIQIDGEKEELFDLVDIFDARAHQTINSGIKLFTIRDYVFNEDYPTQVVFKKLESGKFDIKILNN